eukprot:TRINITY_DN5160_c0_g1_i3.p1 TRINITY_DN5160_c0_g1~~TRINITY_DN5160_c0_g1_i3.p1  ORF type:complete len:690 (-),score=140.37 TRINITY_DN5160_c0_g1_i3:103-2133(-)
MARPSHHVHQNSGADASSARRDQQQTCLSPGLEVGDEVLYQRCFGEWVSAKVTGICRESGICHLKYDVVKEDSSGQQKIQSRTATLHLADLRAMQAGTRPAQAKEAEEAACSLHSQGRPEQHCNLEVPPLVPKQHDFDAMPDDAVEQAPGKRESLKQWPCLGGIAPVQLPDDKDYLLEAVRQDGRSLRCASQRLRDDKDVVLGVVRQDGRLLEFASKRLQDDKDCVLAAVRKHGSSLRFASKSCVLEALKQDGRLLEYASERLQDDTDCVLEAKDSTLKKLQQDAMSLEFAPKRLQDDEDCVLEAVSHHGAALQFASERLQQEKEVVALAVRNDPHSLKFAGQALKLDAEFLKLAGLRRSRPLMHETSTSRPLIVLSVKYALNKTGSACSSAVYQALHDHDYVGSEFAIFNPNGVSKSFCKLKDSAAGHRAEIDWDEASSKVYPCRGHNCKAKHEAEAGQPTAESCWRYSFWWQLQRAKQTGGFMLQVVEYGISERACFLLDEFGLEVAKGRFGRGFQKEHLDFEQKMLRIPQLGEGQVIEVEMAKALQLPVVRFMQSNSQPRDCLCRCWKHECRRCMGWVTGCGPGPARDHPPQPIEGPGAEREVRGGGACLEALQHLLRTASLSGYAIWEQRSQFDLGVRPSSDQDVFEQRPHDWHEQADRILQGESWRRAQYY